MQLNDEQKRAVESWIKEGLGLSDIQKKMASELKLPLTYMDVRLLVIEMGLAVKEKASQAAKAKPGDALSLDDVAVPTGDAQAGVSVEIDRVMRPGSLVSGTVRFSDGVSATWMLDQAGRLALDAGKKKYTPSESDIHAFQEELRRLLEKQGF